MTTSLLRFIVLGAVVLTSCSQKSSPSLSWYKGNLHTHSYWSDGDGYPEMIMDWYKSNGYQFVALSDHNILADGDKWIKVPKSKLHEDGFQQYLTKYGKDWVEYKIDSGRIHVKLKTLVQYQPLLQDKNFLIIKSEEVTDKFQGKPIHMNATNVQKLIPAQGGSSITNVMQRTVDAVLKQREETGVPMFPHINHPNFYYAITAQDMIDLKGERFFEVYNGHPLVHNSGDTLHPGTEEMWDQINMAYIQKGQPLLYGLATDDSHNYYQFGKAFSNSGRGWVMVHADALTPESLIRAMEQGNFYASTGVTLESVVSDNNKLTVKVKAEPGVNYVISFIGAKKGDKKTQLFHLVKGTEASFTLPSDHAFVRAKISSDKLKLNPFKDTETEAAWSQPLLRN